jgi:DNA-binding transcriptional LysR family regulator
LLSVFGIDVEVAALWAAVLGEERIRVGGPELKPHMVQFGVRPSVYRGTLTLPGRRRPIRHLVVASTQLRAEGDQARIIVKGNSSDLVLRAAANFHGLPLLPEWSEWFCQRLNKAGRIRPLSGLNCAPVAIRGTKSEFLEWIGTRAQARPDPNPSTVDRSGKAVGLLPFMESIPMAITTLEEYLREFSVEIGDAF